MVVVLNLLCASYLPLEHVEMQIPSPPSDSVGVGGGPGGCILTSSSDASEAGGLGIVPRHQQLASLLETHPYPRS